MFIASIETTGDLIDMSKTGGHACHFQFAGTNVGRAIYNIMALASHVKVKTLTWAIHVSFEPWGIGF
jgi:hypothetical protein